MIQTSMPGHHFNIIDILPYPVIVGIGTWPAEPLNRIARHRCFILTDHNTSRYCLPLLTERWDKMAAAPSYAIPPGEMSKNISTLNGIWNWLAGAGADRDSVLINLGGGVVTDLGGFAAGTYHRGIRHINIPTSLMGQADAAIGGKTGINLDSVKNQAGLFYDPAAVVIDPSFLSTLPERHLRNGFAEILKSAALAGGELWHRVISLEKISPSEDLITDAIRFKCQLVKSDPLDRSSRKALNFGHTVGHALEGFSLREGRQPLLHGEAVAAGMICEAFLSYKKNSLPLTELEMLTGAIRRYFSFRPVAEHDFDELILLLSKDKKSRQGIPGFTFLKGIGSPVVEQDCSSDEVRESFIFFNRLVT